MFTAAELLRQTFCHQFLSVYLGALHLTGQQAILNFLLMGQ